MCTSTKDSSINMKKSIIALAVALCGGFAVAQASDEIVRDVNYLPQNAQTFLNENFSKKDISFIKIDKTIGFIRDYEVVLTDGTEIDFDREGNWDSIEMPKQKAVPSKIVPKAISNYVAGNYPGQHIVSIDKERHGYDIELQNGLDLVFNKAGQFKKIDD